MIIFFYGLDAYRIKEARDETIRLYKEKYKNGADPALFNLEGDSSFSGLSDFVRSSSFFDEHKLAVLSGAFSKKTVAEDIFKFIDKYKISKESSVTLLFTEYDAENNLKGKSAGLFRELSAGTVKVFEPLEGVKLTEWMSREALSRGCSMGAKACKKLAGRVRGDSWSIAGELDKLAAFKGGSGEITENDIDCLVSSDTELNIFDLTDAITAGNKAGAARLLHLHLASGKDPYHLFALIVAQFRMMLSVMELAEKNESRFEIAAKTKIHPFVVKKICDNNREDLEKLKNRYGALLEAEIKFKGGGGDLSDFLFQFILA